MVEQAEVLTFQCTVPTTPADVFRALTHAGALRAWFCDAAEADPRPGGRIYLWWNDGHYAAGTYSYLQSNAAVTFTWHGPAARQGSEVQVEIRPEGAGTAVTVTHRGVDDLAQVGRRWEAGLENLQSHLASGIDLRGARRPMFGIAGGEELDAAQATQLGVPVGAGFRLEGTIGGLGAQAAGLQRNDVVVSLDGQPICTWHDFGVALSSHQAGDRIPVVFYRGAQQQSVDVELSARPQPAVAPGVAELAAIIRTTFATVDRELDAALAGAGEAEAEYRPAPTAWNVKEVLAHLIAVERDTHSWMLGLIDDTVPDNPFHANRPERVRPLVAVYGTLADLVAELKRSEAVTGTMVANLPAEAVARKHLYNQLATWLTSNADHTREHIEEIRRLLVASGQQGAG